MPIPVIYFNQYHLQLENNSFIKQSGIPEDLHLDFCSRSSVKWLAFLLSNRFFKYEDVSYQKAITKARGNYGNKWAQIREDSSKSIAQKIEQGRAIFREAAKIWCEELTDAAKAKISVSFPVEGRELTCYSSNGHSFKGEITKFFHKHPLQSGMGYIISLAGKEVEELGREQPIIHYFAVGRPENSNFVFMNDANAGVQVLLPDSDVGKEVEDYINRIYRRQWIHKSCAFLPMFSKDVQTIQEGIGKPSLNAINTTLLLQRTMEMGSITDRINARKMQFSKLPLMTVTELAETIKKETVFENHLELIRDWPKNGNFRLVPEAERSYFKEELLS